MSNVRQQKMRLRPTSTVSSRLLVSVAITLVAWVCVYDPAYGSRIFQIAGYLPVLFVIAVAFVAVLERIASPPPVRTAKAAGQAALVLLASLAVYAAAQLATFALLLAAVSSEQLQILVVPGAHQLAAPLSLACAIYGVVRVRTRAFERSSRSSRHVA